MRTVVVSFFLLLMPALLNCVTGAGASGSTDNPNVIVSQELSELRDTNVMDAIQRLRPQWLRVRSRPSRLASEGSATALPKVHIDSVPIGDANELEQVRASEVLEIRYLSAADASTRFGTGYTSGVILITTVR